MSVGTNSNNDNSTHIENLHAAKEKASFYEDELRKKDDLIRKLSEIKLNCNENYLKDIQKYTTCTPDYIEGLTSKLALMQKTIDDLTTEKKENLIKIQVLLSDNEHLKTENLKNDVKLSQNKEIIEQKNANLRDLLSLQSRNAIALSSLQCDVKSKQNKICELIEKNSNIKSSYENIVKSVQSEIDSHKNSLSLLSSLLTCQNTYESCANTIRLLLGDKTELESQMGRLTDLAGTFEYEQRAARETTLRLSGELNKELKNKDNALKEITCLKQELETTNSKLEGSESNIRLLNNRVHALTEALETSHNESEKRESVLRRIAVTDSSNSNQSKSQALSDTKLHEEDIQSANAFLQFARQYLNKIEEDSVPCLFQGIKNQINNLENELLKSQNSNKTSECLIKEMTTSKQTNEQQMETIVEKVRSLENSHAEALTVINNLKEDKKMLQDFLINVSSILKLDEIVSEYPLNLVIDAIETHLHSILTGDGRHVAGQRVKITQLNQQIKELKVKNNSLELQVNMLRKKVSENEDLISTSNKHPGASLVSLEKEKRKINKQLELLKSEFSSMQAENLRIKSELIAMNQNALTAIGTSKKASSAEISLKERCCKQEEDLIKLQQRLANKEFAMNEDHIRSDALITSLTKELAENKTKLENDISSNKHLLEFRTNIMRILGVNSIDPINLQETKVMEKLENLMSTNKPINMDELRKSRNSYFAKQ